MFSQLQQSKQQPLEIVGTRVICSAWIWYAPCPVHRKLRISV